MNVFVLSLEPVDACKLIDNVLTCFCTMQTFQHVPLKADFHSVKIVKRSTFSDHLLFNCKLSPGTVLHCCTQFKKKWSQKVDRATICTEWNQPLRIRRCYCVCTGLCKPRRPLGEFKSRSVQARDRRLHLLESCRKRLEGLHKPVRTRKHLLFLL